MQAQDREADSAPCDECKGALGRSVVQRPLDQTLNTGSHRAACALIDPLKKSLAVLPADETAVSSEHSNARESWSTSLMRWC